MVNAEINAVGEVPTELRSAPKLPTTKLLLLGSSVEQRDLNSEFGLSQPVSSSYKPRFAIETLIDNYKIQNLVNGVPVVFKNPTLKYKF